MTLTTHVAIGAGIGVLVGEPALGFLLGMISHFLVDMIPHGDTSLADRYRIHKERRVPVAYASGDGAFALILLLVLMSIKPEGVTNAQFAWAVMGSALPDLLLGLAELQKNNPVFKAYFRFHFFFHDYFSRRHGDVKLRYALLAQGIFILIIVKFIARIV